ncbi:MAG: ribonuclease III [Lachnospiraceae bacterium]|nr:ribonuclease III [Lachnospiraceae bacterium]
MEEGLKLDPGSLSPLTLAFVGDGVFDLIIRTKVVMAGANRPVKRIHRDKADRVNAHAQAEMAKVIAPLLTEEEAAILKRGRNTHTATVAKHQSIADYRLATGLEALCGYLYMKGEMARLMELIEAGMKDRGENDEVRSEPIEEIFNAGAKTDEGQK